ncbi:restriction endonuclease subunit S [Paenibacillus sp. FSL K6-1122]|uniref:restriction endonuclease subunit S n=1 Tax=Paenibacillus sp. FSL K6-1122 TaxID=2954512 RepID=UPI0030EC59AB
MSETKYLKFKSVFSFIRNGVSIKQGQIDGGYPITRIETIANGIVDRNKMGYAGINDLEKYRDYILHTGDILMSHINSEKHLGKSAVCELEENEKIIHGMNLLCLRSNSKLLNYKFGRYFFLSDQFKIQIPKIIKKSVNQASFNVTSLKELEMTLPPLEVQKRIAQNLDTVSELLALRKKQFDELDGLIQSVFYDMFGDPVTNDMGWEIQKFESIGKLTSGGTPSRSQAQYFTGNINWFSAGELNARYLYESTEKITGQAIQESSAKIFPKGSMLIGMYDTAAFKLGILTQDSSSNQACANLIVNENKININWMYDVCQIMKNTYLSNRRGVRQKNLNLGMIKEFTLPVPPLSLQNQFASIVTKIEEQKSLVKQSIEETQTLFDSLMSQYFN